MRQAGTVVEAKRYLPEIERVLSWRSEAVTVRLRHELGVSERDAQLALHALKQFVVVCALADGARTPSRRLDDVWHVVLLFTREYAELCRCAGTFVHHTPIEGVAERDIYATTRDDALDVFGELHELYWPNQRDEEEFVGCGSIYLP